MAYLNFGIDEVKDLQQSLTAIAPLSPALQVDGDFRTNSTKGLAEAYKKLDVNFRNAQTSKLSNATKLKLAGDFDPALDILNDYAKSLSQRLSGKQWVNLFPTSRLIDDLASPFRQKVQAFEQALRTAGATIDIAATLRPLACLAPAHPVAILMGATIDIAATLRPPQRAYLMHYAFNITKKIIASKNVPSMPGVEIDWVHYTDAASLQAAQEMVNAYNIAFQPVLNSRHIQGLAIDWQITWSGTLNIKNASGTTVSIGTPRSSFTNSRLWNVGATYGVNKLTSDAPHWSSDGH